MVTHHKLIESPAPHTEAARIASAPMPSSRARRERDHEKRRQAITAQQAAAEAYQRKQKMFGIGGLAVIVAIIAGLIFAATRQGSTSTTTGQASTTTSSILPTDESQPQNTAPVVSVAAAPAGERITGVTPCPAFDGSARRVTSFENPPPMCIDPLQEFDVVIHTTQGDIKTSIGNQAAPEIVNNFIVLAAYHYYDDAPIDFVMERGWWEAGDLVDNTGDVSSPGYTIAYDGPDQLVASLSVAMAVQPGTNLVGGRLVVGFGDQVSGVPPRTPVLGLVMDGTDPSIAIGKTGTQSGGVTAVNKITGITITKAGLMEATTTTTTTPR